MTATKHTVKILLAVTCCLFIVLVPLSISSNAQNVLQKGAQGVQKGVETGAEKTKEGAEATGHAIKKGVTGEDTSTSTERMKSEQQTTPGTEQQTTPGTRTQTTRESKRSTTTTEKNEGNLPKTAGELPLLALVGALALGAAGVSRVLHRVRE